MSKDIDEHLESDCQYFGAARPTMQHSRAANMAQRPRMASVDQAVVDVEEGCRVESVRGGMVLQAAVVAYMDATRRNCEVSI
jgi:hypothetical protein